MDTRAETHGRSNSCRTAVRLVHRGRMAYSYTDGRWPTIPNRIDKLLRPARHGTALSTSFHPRTTQNPTAWLKQLLKTSSPSSPDVTEKGSVVFLSIPIYSYLLATVYLCDCRLVCIYAPVCMYALSTESHEIQSVFHLISSHIEH